MQPDLTEIRDILSPLGFVLGEEQPHLRGERYLMRAVTTRSGRKLILLGRRVADEKRVVIKMSNEQGGMRELEHERACRRVLHQIRFAYGTFLSPRELLFTRRGGYLISVQEFIEARPFLERPLKEQFSLALSAFKAQESAHATTYRHLRLIGKTFESLDAEGYLRLFAGFGAPEEAQAFLRREREVIERYCGFLTHTDFVPHNFRAAQDGIYLLDHSSLRFGNKYEGWARFLNFMALYNPALEQALADYVRLNRPEEVVALKCMRVYRLGEIVWYYRDTLARSEGDLKLLNQKRAEFWSAVLDCVLHDRPVPQEVRQEYIAARDILRSEDEKKRQQGLH